MYLLGVIELVISLRRIIWARNDLISQSRTSGKAGNAIEWLTTTHGTDLRNYDE